MGRGCAASTPVDLITQIKSEAFGGVRSWQWQLASSTQLHDRLYDAYGRVIRYRMGGSLRDLSYDAANRITAYTHYDGATAATQPSLDQGFAYDELGRLTGITASTASWSIGYDANGNRTGVTLNGTASTYTTATTSNRISSITNPARSFGYDAAGNTTADTYTATYDLAGRMATLVKAGTTTTYSVDGMGRRVRKFASTGATSTIIFVYDQNGQLLGEYSNTGATLREYVWLGATPVAVFTPDTVAANPPLVYYIHTDHLGTPRLVVDKNNQQRWSWIADPFGTAAANNNPLSLGVFTFNLRFPGQYADSESGLFYNYFRDYDASTGRYAQSDPIGLAGGVNTYAYVGGNPLTGIDSRGLFMTSVDAACLQDPMFCAEIMGQMVKNAGAMSGNECLAQQTEEIADRMETAGMVLSVAPFLGVPTRPLWTSTKKESIAENAYRHFKDHGADFGARNAVDYTRKARDFLRNPSAGVLSKTRANGDVVRFDPTTNAFGVMDKTGAPRTFYKADPAKHGYPTNLDYFNAQ